MHAPSLSPAVATEVLFDELGVGRRSRPFARYLRALEARGIVRDGDPGEVWPRATWQRIPGTPEENWHIVVPQGLGPHERQQQIARAIAAWVFTRRANGVRPDPAWLDAVAAQMVSTRARRPVSGALLRNVRTT